MRPAERRGAADVQPRAFPWPGRGIRLHLLAVLLAVPWLGLVVWWQAWPAWLLALPVFVAIRGLLAGLTDPRKVSDLERRVAALEGRGAGGGGRLRSGPEESDSRE